MRLDKWLKVSRLIKRRTVANEACDNARVTANGRAVKASYDVKVGDVLELRYCEDRTLQEIAGTLGVSVRSVHSDMSSALDWVDMVGIATAKAGVGRAAI